MSDFAIRVGVLKLTDSAPVIAAHELGFFADEGLEVALSIEPSWANVADKLAYGALDAAAIVPPLAIAVSLGLRGPEQRLIVPYALSLGGNGVTLAKSLADAVRAEAVRGGSVVEALAARLRGTGAKLAVVHEYSTHNLQLRYWLATAGVEADRDIEIVVTPPARTLEALRSGRILGFCAGAPWGDIAARAGVGVSIATSEQIWRHAPEKVLGVRPGRTRTRKLCTACCARYIAPRAFATPRETRPTSPRCWLGAPISTSSRTRSCRRCRGRWAASRPPCFIAMPRPIRGARTPTGCMGKWRDGG